MIFTKMRSSNFLDIRKILNALVLLQYVPRFLRIYLSWRKLIRSCTKLARSIWIKAAFDFCVYILASHVLGAFWYFFSIERETACWHMACENHIGCTPRSFNCGRRNFGNYTFLDDDCPVQNPNTTLVDFGIFQEALQSGTVSSTNILQKILHCFWWGLRNLSSLGQNLQTSIDFWENCFAVFISIFGLLLFLYFIGNVQTYIQMATEKATKKVEDIRLKMESIKANIELWMDRNQLPPDMKEPIINCIQHRLEENEDIDMEILISHLSKDLSTKIKRHLCLPLLRKVPILENKDQNLLGRICESLEPCFYSDGNYIFIEGEPIDKMLFITHGSVSCFKTSNGENGEDPQCIKKGEFYGEELLAWGFNGSPTLKLSERPISTKTVKTLTKVEAFALKAVVLEYLVPTHPRTFAKAIAQQGLARSVQKAFQNALYRKEKKNESSTNMAEQNGTSYHARGASRLCARPTRR